MHKIYRTKFSTIPIHIESQYNPRIRRQNTLVLELKSFTLWIAPENSAKIQTMSHSTQKNKQLDNTKVGIPSYLVDPWEWERSHHIHRVEQFNNYDPSRSTSWQAFRKQSRGSLRRRFGVRIRYLKLLSFLAGTSPRSQLWWKLP